MARSQAVMRSAHVALRFDEEKSGVSFRMFLDGNHNGVRTRDIAAGVDRPMEPPARLFELFPGVAIAIADGVEPGDAVRFGSSNLVSFSPLGTASSGTVYVRGRDGLQLAIRVLGVTGRTRVLRYAPRTRTWVDSF